MKIEYRLGDFFTVRDASYLVHGCNAQGQMGRGVAYTMRYEIYPKVWKEYREHYDAFGLNVGDVVPVKVDQVVYKGNSYGVRTVFNAITQDQYSGKGPGFVYADTTGIRKAIKYIDNFVDMDFINEPDTTIQKVAMPLIGAGLAGGDWGEIAEIIEQESTKFQPIVYAYSQADMDRAMQAVAAWEKRKQRDES
jgi:O-acetyl-ADP-ribose deacetylase (regulator of RNase III)